MKVPPSRIIKELILNEDLGEDSDLPWRVFISFLPNDPNNAICIYDTMGRPDGRMMGTGERIIHPGVQIMVRGKDYLEVWKRANDIALLLDVQKNRTFIFESEAHVIQSISRMPILHLGIESKEESDRKRHIFTINATMTITPTENYSLLMAENGESNGGFVFLAVLPT